MTKLDAVNEMLEAIGLAAVSALDTGGTSEEAEAERILDRDTDRVLARGWSANTADEREFSLTGSNISMSGIYSFTGDKYGKQYAIKDSLLYDPEDDTIVFTASVTLCGVVFSLTFTQIPDHIARFIVAQASLNFVRFKRQDIGEDRRWAAALDEARRHAKAIDARIQKVNLTQTAEAHLARGYPHGRR